MPRKQFVQDLQKASFSGAYSNINGIKKGEDDESICFSFNHAALPSLTLDFQAAVSDVSEYPYSHYYLIYSTSASVPPSVVDILEVIQTAVAGASIFDLLSTANEALENLFSVEDLDSVYRDRTMGDTPIAEDVSSPHFDPQDSWGGDDDFFDEDQQFFGSDHKPIGQSSSLRPDLRATKTAGFKVGYLGDLNGSLIVSVSCRIAKLGISEEAMQAWGVQSTQYLVLLIRFPTGYRKTTDILKMHDTLSGVQMHVGLCASYKPSMPEAIQAFARTFSIPSSLQSGSLSAASGAGKLLPLFLELPLGSLLNERFITILRLRHQHSLSWSGAETFFNDSQGLVADCQGADEGLSDYHRFQDEWSATVPRLVQDDHFSIVKELESLSFPLVAMQFTLRHFVKCTEFCLVCHCKIHASFEALKPYVCSKPLCLYQYMALGMGPSLEWEISRQPLVTDLLVSFAYASAAAGIMEDLPVGLKLMVPPIHEESRFHTASLQLSDMQITVQTPSIKPSLSPGDWILIDLLGMNSSIPNDSSRYRHCRVNNTDKWPTIDISDLNAHQKSKVETKGDPNKPMPVRYALYEINFDEIKGKAHKREIIVVLLDSLPDVLSMKQRLDLRPSGSRMLSTWEDVPRASLDLLRWIVASNRSCIMQDSDITGKKQSRPHGNLVTGMSGRLQFRFAQGSPDKEEKFVSAVSENASNSKSKYPTIFAWHGSPLSNWHSIIREGLHYKKTSNGRAHGHGVYMAQHFQTSSSYGARHVGSQWSNSILSMHSALSLNEVVNQTGSFVANQGGVYVVDRFDWIQTRYLFVDYTADKTKLSAEPPRSAASVTEDSGPVEYYAQDPQHVAIGSDGKQIQIPLTIFSRSRRNLAVQRTEQAINTKPQTSLSKKRSKATTSHSKKRKSSSIQGVSKNGNGNDGVLDNDNSSAIIVNGGGHTIVIEDDDDDNASVKTLAEDMAALLSDAECANLGTEASVKKPKGLTKSSTHPTTTTTTTDFKPGTLTETSITILEPPSYASSSATKTLQQRLLQALKAQEQTHLDELGWYIDPQLISNPYQWIVELHSFEVTHPLGQDLQKAGIQSLILEMRFPADFPMSPPFVRVIRPRLLEFNQGGGGHVTTGGALCMELLTGSGWLPTFSIENVLVSIRLALCSMDPRPARLSPGQSTSGAKEYTVQEAVQAYTRACNLHGWEVPKNFSKLAW